MMSEVYDIEYELPERRAFIKGDHNKLPVGKRIVIVDENNNFYDADVINQVVPDGVVVKVNGYALW